MKIIEQYLTAIGYGLPLRKRRDIQNELRSLLLDDIEERFGPEPSEEEVRTAIRDFGSPGEVAARYQEGREIIAEGFRDIYFLILKIVFGALAIAFTVLFFVELAAEPAEGLDLLVSILTIPMRVFTAGMSAAGIITLIFIALTRFYGEKAAEAGLGRGNWSVDELKHISIEEEAGSVAGAAAGLIIGGIFVLSILIYPQVISVLETLFERSGIMLGHHVRIEVFQVFSWLIAGLWLAEMAVQVMTIRQGKKSPRISDAEIIVDAFQAAVFGIMVFLDRLYITGGELNQLHIGEAPVLQSPDWIGFRMIFLIIFIVALTETAVRVYKKMRRMLAG
jgi:hypothetical protein